MSLLKLGFDLNNREWASLFWLTTFVLWGLSRKEARSALVHVFRVLLGWKVLVAILSLFAWIALEVWIAAGMSLWRWALTKDTILWILTAGIASFLSYHKTSEPDYFRHGVVGAVSATVLLEYFINLAVFSLWIEFIMQFVVAVLVRVSVVAQCREEYQKASLMASCLLGGIILALLIHTGIHVYYNRHVIYWNNFIIIAIVPIWLAIGLLPFIYSFNLVATYGTAFLRMDLAAENGCAPWWAKIALISKLRLRSRDVRAAAQGGTYKIANASSFSEALRAATEFQESLRERERVEQERQARLLRYASSQAVNAEGRPLDRREFQETKRALLRLANCQIGWYRRGNRYRQDLLDPSSTVGAGGDAGNALLMASRV